MRLKVPAGAVAAANFEDWTLYELPSRDADSFLWIKFKLMLPPNVRAKRGATRVYRLAWHAGDSRFARDAKLMDLQRAHPSLYAQVELYLSLKYSEDCLMATPAEITAERARLAAARKERRASK